MTEGPEGPASQAPEKDTGFVSDYLLYLLAAASAAASGPFHALLRHRGIRTVEWRVLACLHDEDGQTVGQLAGMTLFEPTRLTRILDQMEAAGLILRADDTADRRRRRLTLTEHGRSIAAELVAHARAHQAAVIGAVGAEDIAQMKRTLMRLIDRAPQVSPPGQGD